MSSDSRVLKQIKHVASDGRPPIQYRIQLVDESSVDTAVSFMLKYFAPRENINISLGGTTFDENEVKELESLWKKKLSKGVSLGAFLENNEGDQGDLISCHVMSIEEKNNPKIVEGNKLTERRQKKVQIIKDLMAKVDVFAFYDCSSYISDHGLAVAPEYEGRGIGSEMLRAIGDLCRRINVPVAAIDFTGLASQKAAAKSGFQTLAELDISTHRINGKIVCPNPKCSVIKCMGIKYF